MSAVVIPAHWIEMAARAIEAAPGTLSADGWDADRAREIEVDQVATALAFLRCGPCRLLCNVPPRAESSYGLKHVAERWGRAVGLAPYVANGAMITAGLHLHVPMKRHPWRHGPNCTMAVRVDHDRLERMPPA